MSRKRKPISAEEFDAWREDLVTQWVLAELGKAAAAQKAAWTEMSWGNGIVDPTELHILKTRADAYSVLAEVTFEDIAEIAE